MSSDDTFNTNLGHSKTHDELPLGFNSNSDTFNTQSGAVDLEKKYKKAGILAQLFLLIKKNTKVIFGRAGFLFAHLFTTALVCAVILLINYLTQYSYANEPSQIYSVQDVQNIKKCDFSDNCKSLGYVILVSPLKAFYYNFVRFRNFRILNSD